MSTLHHKSISEDDVARLVELAISYPIVSPGCRQIAIPFLCQYVYPPCVNDTSYKLITAEQCIHVRDRECATEWLLIESIVPGLLPSCEIFNDDMPDRDNSRFKQNKYNESFCTDQFITYCNKLCVPSCKRFSQHDKAATSYRKAIDIIAITAALIGGILFTIIVVVRRKNL